MKAAVALAAFAAFGLAGCYGEIGDVTTPDPDGPRNLCEVGERDVPGPRLVRRTTGPELGATIRGGFGLTTAEWAGPSVPSDAAGRNGFTNNVDRLIVDDAYARGLLTTAEQVADAVLEPTVLARVLPCAASGGEACARTYLETVGRRLYRRPMTDAEAARYLELHAAITAEEDFATWVRWATVAMVQSPHVVYRSELGEPADGGYRLTGYEIATALAFTLSGTSPDDGLLDAAARGDLDTPEGVAAAAETLAAGGALRDVFLAFSDQWLGLSQLGNLIKSAESFPGFDATVRDAMRRETDGFLERVVFEEQGGMRELLTSPVSVFDATLGGFYGWGGGGVATRPEGWGVGLLAQGALLTINAGNEHTSPTQRGLLVRERLLCTEMPPPPPVVGDIPAPTGNETTRERYEEHTANAACSDCHLQMDPIGFTFEHLDATGRYRATEGPFPIDDTGAIHGVTPEPIPVTGPVELAEALAAEPATATCVASYMASYAYGLDHHDTTCLVSSLAEDLAAGNIGLADFYLGLVATTHFTRRVD